MIRLPTVLSPLSHFVAMFSMALVGHLHGGCMRCNCMVRQQTNRSVQLATYCFSDHSMRLHVSG